MSFGIIAGAAIGAGATLIGSNKAAKAQTTAAQTTADANTEAARLLQEQYKTTEGHLKPFITGEGGPQSFQMQQALSGAQGAEAQQAAYNQFVESPGVAFLRERGMRGIEQNAAASGNLFSGNTMKALSEFNQGLALQDFNNYYNRLGSLTGTSLNAAQALAGVGGQAASGQAALTSQSGANIAQGQIGAAQSYQSAYQNLGSALGTAVEAWGNRPRSNTAQLGGWQGSGQISGGMYS